VVGSAYLGNKGCSPPAEGLYLPPPREVQSEVVGCIPSPVQLDSNGVNTGGIEGIPGCTYRNPAIEVCFAVQSIHASMHVDTA
jgi:hypothetical protein